MCGASRPKVRLFSDSRIEMNSVIVRSQRETWVDSDALIDSRGASDKARVSLLRS